MMRWIAADGVELAELDGDTSTQLVRLLEKYRDLPMDLVDASLVLLAAKTGLVDVLTLDRRDFSTYRLPGNKRFHLVLGDWQPVAFPDEALPPAAAPRAREIFVQIHQF